MRKSHLPLAAAGVGLCLIAYRVFADDHRALDAACLRDLGGAISGYRQYNAGAFPPGALSVKGRPIEKGYSWIVPILSYFENASMFLALDLDKPWDDGVNAKVADLRMAMKSTDLKMWAFRFEPGPELPTGTPFVAIAGVGKDAASLPVEDKRAGVFGHDRRVGPRDITDGLSSTMMLANTEDVSGHWMQAGPATLRGVIPERRPYIGKGRPFGGAGGASVLFADGSIRWVKESVAPEIVEAMATIGGGERVPETGELVKP